MSTQAKVGEHGLNEIVEIGANGTSIPSIAMVGDLEQPQLQLDGVAA